MSPSFTAGAVVYAKDIEHVGHFYEELAGLSVTQRESDFAVLESGFFQLTVVAMAAAVAQRTVIASPPVRRENTAIKLCFAVPCLAAARATPQRLGGALNPPEHEWEFQGHRVCDGHDPEGNVIQVRCVVR